MTISEIEGQDSDSAPKTILEAIASTEAKSWINSIYEEIKSLIEHNVFEVFKRPHGRKIVDNKWCFNYKINNNGEIVRYKSRLVGKGYTQRYGIDYLEVFAPVCRSETIRILMAYTARNDNDLLQFDVRTAFLNGNLEEEIYMNMPELPDVLRNLLLSKACEDQNIKNALISLAHSDQDQVLKLRNAIYGLKQSSKQWYKVFKEALEECGFIQACSDPCLLIYERGEHSIFCLFTLMTF